MAELLIDAEDYLDLLKDLTEAAITGLTTSSGTSSAEEIAGKAVDIATQAAHAILARVAEQEDFLEDDEDEEEEEDEGDEEEAEEGGEAAKNGSN